MKEIDKHQKAEAFVLGFVAMTSLGLVSTNNLKTVKADPISSKQLMTTTKEISGKASAGQPLENKNQSNEPVDQDTTMDNSQNSTDTNNSVDANISDSNHVEKYANKSDVSKTNTDEVYCMWNGLKVTYDTVNSILTIPGSSEVIQNPEKLDGITFSPSPDNDAETIYSDMIKKIKITGPLKFSGSLTGFFDGMSNLTEIEGLNNFDTSEVTDMSYMFNSCEKLTSVDLSSFDTHNVRDMDYMFARCLCLEELDLSKFKLTNLQNADQMLQELPELSLLVLGANASGYGEPEKYNILTHCELDTPGTWFKVGKGTDDEPEGLKQWSSGELRENFRGETDADRYVRLAYLTVHYVDEKKKKIAADSTIKARRLSKKTIEPKVIPGYTLKTSPVNYRFIDGQNEITYFYYPTPPAPVMPNQVSNVTVKYQDEKGNPLSSDEILAGKIGDGYVSWAKDISGYSLKSRPTNATGFFSGQAQTVIYVYSLIQQNNKLPVIPVRPNRPIIPSKPNRHSSSNKSGSSKNSKLTITKVVSKASDKNDLNIRKGISHRALHYNGHKLNNSVNNSQNKKLPQTSFNRKSQFTMLALGAVALLAGLFEINVKRKGKGKD